MTLAEITSAVEAEVGSKLATLIPAGAVARWFNEGQARLQWYKDSVIGPLTWLADASTVDYGVPVVEVVEILYPEDAQETRWRPGQGSLLIQDYNGAEYAGSLKLLARVYWDEVDGATSSELPRDGDAACIAYVLHRFFRFLSADRAVYQRYAVLMGENGVGIDDLSDISDNHYRDFLDLRTDLPLQAGAAFYVGD